MCEIRTVFWVLLVSLSLSWQHALAQYEYEYYYYDEAKDFGRPEIVLNIFSGMYGMHRQSNNRGGKNQAGRNRFWPRGQSLLQGWYNWYGMNNRAPVQYYKPIQRKPVYRGRAPPRYDYNDSYGYQYPPAKPKRNQMQQKPTALEQQASMAVFNFLLQALGQRSTSSRSQSQTQRRRT
uniref:Uncharacterized protein n=1 Tax=Anopheles farauti TaxID=69004 RepID=A0A182Q3V3_9DIPT